MPPAGLAATDALVIRHRDAPPVRFVAVAPTRLWWRTIDPRALVVGIAALHTNPSPPADEQAGLGSGLDQLPPLPEVIEMSRDSRPDFEPAPLLSGWSSRQ